MLKQTELPNITLADVLNVLQHHKEKYEAACLPESDAIVRHLEAARKSVMKAKEKAGG